MTGVKSRGIGIAAIILAIAFPIGVVVVTQRTCPDVNVHCTPVVLETMLFFAVVSAPFLSLAGAIIAIRRRARVVGGVGLALSILDLLLFAALIAVALSLKN